MIRGRRGALESLSRREREVLDGMAAGRSNRGIADTLFISDRAVERHVTAIFGKLDLPATEHSHRRVMAVLAHVAAAG